MIRKRIVIYGDSMNLSGGRERVIANLINLWSEEYDITLLVKDDGESYYPLPDTISVLTLGIPMKLDMNSKISRIITIFKNLLVSIRRLKSILSQLDYDYLYVSTPLNAFESFCAMKDPNRKLVISEHASMNSFNAIYTWMKKLVYNRSYCLSVPNKMDTVEYVKEGCNAFYIPHPLTFTANSKNALDSKIMLNVGRLTCDKQQDVLIRAWSHIKEKNGWQLWIVGEGEEKNNLDTLITILKQQESIKLFPARKNIKEIYQKASCFVLTSRCEGFGMVLLEAMAFGVPCVSFDCPSGPRDIIINGYNGILVENNIESLERSLVRILNLTDDALSELGTNAWNTVINWNNEAILDQWRKCVFK